MARKMIPQYTTLPEALRPLADRLGDALLTASEVAKHLRYSPNHMSNLRKAGKGFPWLELPTGAIRYRASEVFLGEVASERGPLSVDRVVLAIAACEKVPLEHRAAIVEHVRGAFRENGK